MPDFRITYDLGAMDLDPIVALIADAYWAQGDTPDSIRASFDHSACVGLLLDGNAIGFARAISDHSRSAHIKDVVILPDHQKAGHGLRLIKALLNHPDLKTVPRWHLGTTDAQAFYTKLGFKMSPDGVFMHLRR